MNSLRILVTGAGGFIGSHLVEYLTLFHNVRALVHYNSASNPGNLKNLPIPTSNIELIYGDITDYHFMDEATKDIDIIFNLAALISIPHSYSSPKAYIDTNIIGAYNILELATKKGIRTAVISTSEVYGSATTIPISLDHQRYPQSPYAATKVAQDALALSYFCSYGTPATIIRPFNTYGPRQSLRAIIPQIITQFQYGPVITLGNIETTRDFVYVKDTVQCMYKLLMDNKTVGKEVQIATGEEISIEQLAHKIASLMNIKNPIIKTDPSRTRPTASEVTRLCGESSIPTAYTIDQGLQETINYFTTNKQQPTYRQ